VICRRSGSYEKYFIGLHKETPTINGVTYWLDGSTSTYRNYDIGEPDDDLSCFFIRADNNGYFEDGYCTSTEKNYICQITSGSLYMYPTVFYFYL